MAQEILKGIRVLDFTWVLAGPYATRILADFGAEVIKIQSKKTAKGAESDTTGYFNNWNRNKKSITLDMSFLEAKEIFLKLVSKSDILIENFSPRVMENWGLSYQRLREVNPHLIMVSLSAMGQTGPWRDFVAYGPTLQALSGLSYLSSFSETSPMGLGYAFSDSIAGLYTVFAILSALEYRERKGQGQYIDLSEYEAICTLMGPHLLDVLLNHREIKPQGNRSYHIPASPYGCYKCLGIDRWCVIAVFTEAQWKALGRAMQYPEWMREEKFATLSKRKENEEALDTLIEQWTSQYPPEEIVRLLQESGVPAGVVQNAEDLVNDPHLRARDFFVNLYHPILGKTISDTCPIKFKGSPPPSYKAAPLLGEDNRYVFIELLNLTENEFSSYMEKGIIG